MVTFLNEQQALFDKLLPHLPERRDRTSRLIKLCFAPDR